MHCHSNDFPNAFACRTPHRKMVSTCEDAPECDDVPTTIVQRVWIKARVKQVQWVFSDQDDRGKLERKEGFFLQVWCTWIDKLYSTTFPSSGERPFMPDVRMFHIHVQELWLWKMYKNIFFDFRAVRKRERKEIEKKTKRRRHAFCRLIVNECL